MTDRLNSIAYETLSAYGICEENNRYGAGFGERLEPGLGMSRERLKQSLEDAVT